MSAVDLDLLADYVGGALDGTPEHEQVARLVADDPDWRSAAADLTTALAFVDADLAILGAASEPMPDDIAARFDALLASPEFAASRPVPPRTAVGERTLNRDASGSRTARLGRRRWAAPVAVAAGVLALAGIVLPFGPLATSQQDAGTGFSAENAPAIAVAPDSRVPVTASGTDYRRQMLADGTTMSKSTPTSETFRTFDSSEKAAAADLGRLSGSGEALTSCFAAISTVLPGTVTGADFARFEGRPALIVTVDTATGGWWFVAGPQCGQPGPDELFRAPRN